MRILLFFKSAGNCFFFLGSVFWIVGIPLSLAATEVKQPRVTDISSSANYGEDVTRPLARFDMRFKYRDNGNGSDTLRNVYRLDYPLRLPDGWRISTRTEIPIMANDTKVPDNSAGKWGMGLGDLLTQTALVSPEEYRFRCAAGLRVIWPSATKQQLGLGKYQLAPTAGVGYTPRALPPGSFVSFIWREEWGAGGDKDRSDIHKSVFNPDITVSLPHRFYAELSPEIVMNWRDDGKVFVPFNLSAGKKIGEKIIVSLEWNQALVKQYRPYDWDIEARVGYFF